MSRKMQANYKLTSPFIVNFAFLDEAALEVYPSAFQYSILYHIILKSFLQACEAITQAAGSLVLLFSDQKLTNDTSNILNSFLQLYKREKPSSTFPRYIITLGVSNFLSVVPRAALQPHLDTLLNTLHMMVSISFPILTLFGSIGIFMNFRSFRQVVITPDFKLPVTVKNHNELLRCYDYLSK